MQLLHTPHDPLPFAHGANRAYHARSRRERRDKGNFVLDRGPADLVFRDTRYFAARGIDNKLDFAVLDRVDNIGAAFAHFADRLGGNAMLSKKSRGSARRDNAEAEIEEAPNNIGRA